MEKKNKQQADLHNPADIMPGVQTEIADKDKVDKKAVKQEVRILNNNPRNDDWTVLENVWIIT